MNSFSKIILVNKHSLISFRHLPNLKLCYSKISIYLISKHIIPLLIKRNKVVRPWHPIPLTVKRLVLRTQLYSIICMKTRSQIIFAIRTHYRTFRTWRFKWAKVNAFRQVNESASTFYWIRWFIPVIRIVSGYRISVFDLEKCQCWSFETTSCVKVLGHPTVSRGIIK